MTNLPDSLALNNAAHAQNIAYLSRVLQLVTVRQRIAAIDLLIQFRWHERMRLRARYAAGLLGVPSPHESRYQAMIVVLRAAIVAAMQGEECAR